MTLDWQAVPSSSKTVSHPVVLRARLPHGWLVATQVHGGFSVTFVPFAEADAKDAAGWRRED
jgi:hypothetical protein